MSVFCSSRFMVIRESRLFMRGRRVLPERFHNYLDGFLKLRVAARAPQFRVHLDFDIRGDSVVFDVPRSIRTPECDARCGDKPAVDQLRIVVDANQSAPGAFPYQRSDAGFAE